MDGAASLLIIVSAGYLLCVRCYKTKYWVARQAGHRLYLTSAAAGSALASASYVSFISQEFLWSLTGRPYLILIDSERFASTIGISSLLMAYIFAEMYNRLRPYSKSLNLWKAWQNDDMDKICSDAQEQFKPISITLDTGKAYVGIVYDSLEPDHSQSYLTILPYYSGYRSDKDSKLVLNNTYSSVITLLKKTQPSNEREHLSKIEDYCITFARRRIVTINIFNQHLYEGFNKKKFFKRH